MMNSTELIIDDRVIEKIKDMLSKACPYGSVEIIIQDRKITQISFKHIEKIFPDKPPPIHKNTLDIDQYGHIVKRNEI